MVVEIEIMVEYYVGQNKTLREMEKYFEVSKETIRKRLRKAGIETIRGQRNALRNSQKRRLEELRQRWGFKTIEELDEHFELGGITKPKVLEMWKEL